VERTLAISDGVQQFVTGKSKDGYAWETTDHLRNLMSKIMSTAVSWNYRGTLSLHRDPGRFPEVQQILVSHLAKPRCRPRAVFWHAAEIRRLLRNFPEMCKEYGVSKQGHSRNVHCNDGLVRVLLSSRLGEILGAHSRCPLCSYLSAGTCSGDTVRTNAAAPDRRLASLRFAGTIDLDQAVNRTAGPSTESALIAHYEIKVARQGR
jgi:hypothetical protein